MSEKPLLILPDAFIADTAHMSASEVGAFGLLLISAWRSEGGVLADDDQRLARTAKVGLRAWQRMKPTVLALWTLDEAGWRPSRRHFGPTPRRTIAPSIRARVLSANECRYCSDTTGPFEIDHVIPLALGGDDEEVNLVCACFACNRSKRDRLLSEWTQ